ncbi:AraC family transcriptional regulator [Novosphingobium sp. BL-8H]|uniref:AraC family transcriptional regulator n=1 Tax=Novosphingobium sp. BL-8H TaxID=3127640 RepID=UPI0037572469
MSALAPLLRVRPMLEDLCHFGGDWAAPHAADPAGWAQFHLVLRGTCTIERDGVPPIVMAAGDILLLPRGDAHVVRARLGGARGANRIAVEYRSAIRFKTNVDGPADTELVCGRLEFEAASEALVTGILPPTIVLRANDWPNRTLLDTLLAAIRDELDGGAPGAIAIATDLGSALFVMLIRTHLATEGTNSQTMRLFARPATRRVALAMLRGPATEWTLDALVQIAAMSRATLVRAFRDAAGMAPLEFLTDLRLGLARQRLARSNDPIAIIAADVGYRSEATFSRAFLRKYGLRPGALRGR